MNGIHDVGGMDGFTLPVRDQGRVLKEEWERLVWGVTFAMRGVPGLPPTGRRAVEAIPPELYLSMPYYARWLYAREQILLALELVTEQELRNPDGPITKPRIPGYQAPGPQDVVAGLSQDASAELDVDVAPLFAVGDVVMVKNEHPPGHTRVPRYVRGHRGTIYREHGVHQFQDDIPPEADLGPQHLYSVVFTGPELWGSRGHPNDRVHVELWDSHLESAA